MLHSSSGNEFPLRDDQVHQQPFSLVPQLTHQAIVLLRCLRPALRCTLGEVR